MRHTVYLAFALAIIWLTNSGHYDALILSFGVLSVVFVVWISRSMEIVDDESQPVMLLYRLPAYWLWLVKKIVSSNIEVVRYIWLKPEDIDPVTAKLPISQKTDLCRVIYANSITLTPGTVTFDLSDKDVVVHALTRDGLAELQDGEMDRKVSALEK